MSEKKKYVVEASEPRSGQKASSGGIRKANGTMSEMYCNPVPYDEYIKMTAPQERRDVVYRRTTAPQVDYYADQVRPQSAGDLLKRATLSFAKDVGSRLWAEYAPRFSAMLSNEIESIIDNKVLRRNETLVKETIRQKPPITKSEKLLEQYESAVTTFEFDMPSNVIQFSRRQVS